jgi:dimeric dUTPase (all-alpha-NTP-PPase superfamily)
MSDVNICSGAEIVNIEVENPFAEMYLLQRRLQYRLKGDEHYTNIAAHEASLRNIYWYFCIASECKELLDWFDPSNQHELPREEVDKEIKMEAIDILHFVMNMALELHYTAEFVESIALKLPLTPFPQKGRRCKEMVDLLQDSCINLIEATPWKTWKNYQPLTIEDVNEITQPLFKKVFQFTLFLCCTTGLSGQDIINTYFAKNAINHQRQDNGY